MLQSDGQEKPLTARDITSIDKEINPYTRSERADRFVASQRDVFARAFEDAVVSLSAQLPGTRIKVDPLKIEEEVIKMIKTRQVMKSAEGLASAVAQAVADAVSRSQNADKATAGQLSQAAVGGVSKSAATASIPKIRNREEFVEFVKNLTVDSQYGSVQEDEKAPDINGTERQTHIYNGIVFRSDDRPPTDRTMKRGFERQNDLSVPEHKTEALGFGTNQDGKIGAFGSTGKSGVSCSRTVNGSLGYLNPGRTYYIIDTTKIPKGEKAWDMKCNMYENGLMERRMVPVEIEDPDSLTGVRDVEEPLDETGGEVNVSYIPRNAIIGWVSVSNMHMDTADDNRQCLDTLQRRISWDKNYTIQFNPEYKA